MTLTETPPRSASTTALPPGRLFIGGQWRDASDGGRMDVIAPATGKKLTDVAKATTADVDAAVAAARAAFDSGVWSGLSSRERARILQRAYTLMRERSEELAHAESTNVGKPITFARVVDVNNAAELYEYYASLGHHLDGSVRETTGNTHVYVKKEPIGVVAAITPFNFPLILSSTKIAPALHRRQHDRAQAGERHPAECAADGADPAGGGCAGRRLQRRDRLGRRDRRSPRRASGRRQGRLHRLDRDRRARGAARRAAPSSRSPPNSAATPPTSSSRMRT